MLFLCSSVRAVVISNQVAVFKNIELERPLTPTPTYVFPKIQLVPGSVKSHFFHTPSKESVSTSALLGEEMTSRAVSICAKRGSTKAETFKVAAHEPA